ncbi:multicopper oxidase domain-containing protein [Maritimibacter sp. DP07]|uniref:Multicopper oxidase domain-containing protein n=1 Tax=Maritimibacter harenae TaxID=2606218 RepID=A0A845M9Y6_9RHOB|nr:multicopper oxidase family protein [Maritimibacter harenae]MZR15007.1 multicopper oxidase domain-containing protein [Maritimibacter harenae]
MSGFHVTRRAFCAGSAAALALRPALAAGDMPSLVAKSATRQIAPEGYPATDVWAYEGQIPGPLIRATQGERITRRLVNQLEVPTSVHWHGIRIDNAMDGVAGLTQEAVPPGATFDYDFAVPDAGTYWYHAHTNSMEQVARGLSGPLIVDEVEAPDVDRDEVLMLDDWLIEPETGQLYDDFDQPMMLSHAGRQGNLIGTNGQYRFELPAKSGSRMRLRLINAANARIFVLRLEGLSGWTVALDGMPLERPMPVMQEIILAPAQRVDLIVDVSAADGETAAILRLDDDDQWRAQAAFPVKGVQASASRGTPDPLPPNPNTALPELGDARALDMVMEGGAMGRLNAAIFEGRRMGFRDLVDRGQFWSLAGQVGMGDAPFARLDRGEAMRMRIDNRTVFPHAMHLHGMHFREVAPDGTLGPLRDTVLSIPGEATEIAFTADNPGSWLFHCHMLGHAASGMTTWIEVA